MIAAEAGMSIRGARSGRWDSPRRIWRSQRRSAGRLYL